MIMSQNLLQYLGILGNILLVVAYLPQIKKIIVTKKSEDVSALTWFIIFLGDFCMLAYAVVRNETIFAVLFTIFEIENLVVLYLTLKFKPKPELHKLSPRENMKEKMVEEKSAGQKENPELLLEKGNKIEEDDGKNTEDKM